MTEWARRALHRQRPLLLEFFKGELELGDLQVELLGRLLNVMRLSLAIWRSVSIRTSRAEISAWAAASAASGSAMRASLQASESTASDTIDG